MSTEICTNVRISAQEIHEIGKKVRNLRRNMGDLTQTQFAQKYGIALRVVSYIESGERLPSSELLYLLRRENHDLNQLMAPLPDHADDGSAGATMPTPANQRTQLLADALGVAVSEDDAQFFATYCGASDTVKLIIQSVLRAGDASK